MKLGKIPPNKMLWILSNKEENKAVSLHFREIGKMTSCKKTDAIQNQRLFLSSHAIFYIYHICTLICLPKEINGSILNFKKLLIKLN